MTTRTVEQIPSLTLGWRLQMALAHASLTTEQIADELGYSRSSVSRWVNDKGPVRPMILKEWALRCGVPLHERGGEGVEEFVVIDEGVASSAG